MSSAPLKIEIEAFERDRDRYRQSWGPAWVVVVGADAQGHFPEFADAARFAFDRFPDEMFLIRHTDPEPEFIPFIAVG